MPDNHPMPALFAGTQDVSDALKARGVEVVDIEAHDANDPDSCDRIWLSRYADGERVRASMSLLDRLSTVTQIA